MITSRRKLILATISGTAFALAGCKTITNGSSTSVVLDTSKIKKYATAGINAGLMLIGIVDTVPSLSMYSTKLNTYVIKIKSLLSTFDEIVGNNLVFNYDSTNYKTIVDSLLFNISNILGIIQEITTARIFDTDISEKVDTTIATINIALSTVVNIYRVMIGTIVDVASNGTGGMSEDQALTTLKVI